MACTLCLLLESTVARLERTHLEMRDLLRAKAAKAAGDEFGRLKLVENNARLDLEITRLELAQHKQSHAQAYSA